MSTKKQIATLAGGCFWCLEAAFNELKGVENVVSGYAGGSVPHPTYEQVCTGETGHAEAVQITFNADLLSFGDLLRIFFSLHDPTTLNRQGPDVGTQYRSAIFYHDETQRTEAEKVIRELTEAGLWDHPIVTEVTPFTNFYPAEAYHQNYFARNPWQPYCRTVVAPKVAKFRKQFVERLKSSV
ncbi:MAG: peptide-methionine (S)-S-oxide reductase MsrA [Candidatus Villigracilaceae bacterium]